MNGIKDIYITSLAAVVAGSGYSISELLHGQYLTPLDIFSVARVATMDKMFTWDALSMDISTLLSGSSQGRIQALPVELYKPATFTMEESAGEKYSSSATITFQTKQVLPRVRAAYILVDTGGNAFLVTDEAGGSLKRTHTLQPPTSGANVNSYTITINGNNVLVPCVIH